MKPIKKFVVLFFLFLVFAGTISSVMAQFRPFGKPVTKPAFQVVTKPSPSSAFTEDFNIEDCTFTNIGSNQFFILVPGHQLILEGYDKKEFVHLEITVLDTTEVVDGVVTRVVEERESIDGEIVEVSRNFFVICEKTNDVFYFGEDVDNYVNGTVDNHDGSWRAGINDAKPGVIMPGTYLLGSRYFQEIAPDEAMDRAHHLEMNLTVTTPLDTFENCVRIEETTPLEPNAKDYKCYAPGIGLIKDGTIELVGYNSPVVGLAKVH